MPHNSHNKGNGSQKDSLKHDLALFTGFKSALEACYLDWDEYILPGITYTAENNPMYHCPFTCFRHAGDTRTEVNQVSTLIDLFIYLYRLEKCLLNDAQPIRSGKLQFSGTELSPTHFASSS